MIPVLSRCRLLHCTISALRCVQPDGKRLDCFDICVRCDLMVAIVREDQSFFQAKDTTQIPLDDAALALWMTLLEASWANIAFLLSLYSTMKDWVSHSEHA